MKYMTCLRHLYTHGCSALKSMPAELGKLTKLQTLTCFVAAVNGPDCSDVSELQQLNLGGRLELCQVENVIEAEAKVASLGRKKDIRELTLRWTSVNDSEVLKKFEPHDGLKVLTIHSYGGNCIDQVVQVGKSHVGDVTVAEEGIVGNGLRWLLLRHLLNEAKESGTGRPIFLFFRSSDALYIKPQEHPKPNILQGNSVEHRSRIHHSYSRS